MWLSKMGIKALRWLKALDIDNGVPALILALISHIYVYKCAMCNRITRNDTQVDGDTIVSPGHANRVTGTLMGHFI